MGNVAASYDSANGILSLTSAGATATLAQWGAALSSIAYSAAGNAPSGNRTVTFVVNDGTKSSGGAADTVAVVTPPVLTADTGSAAFTAGDNTTGTPVKVSPGVTVTDVSTSTLSAARVSITTGFQASEDRLAFTNDSATMGDITSVYNTATGVLTMTSGSHATLAQWQNALRAVTFQDIAVTPNTATRTVSFVAIDSSINSLAVIRTVTLADVDQTPTITTSVGTTSVYRDASATTIDAGLTVGDRDNATLPSATVAITANFRLGDTLSFTGNGTTMGDITGSYDPIGGTLTLTSTGGAATLAQWQAALRAVGFSSPSTTYATRTVSFSATDGTNTSIAGTRSVSLLSPDPVVTTTIGSSSFQAADNAVSTPVAVDPNLAVTHPLLTTLVSASAQITANLHTGEDQLPSRTAAARHTATSAPRTTRPPGR